MDIKTVTGKNTWDTTTIQKMLKNEKYKGDTLLQKTFTEDFMTGKKVKNTGQRTQYFVSESHPAIVAVEVFDRVQDDMAKRSRVIHHEDGTVSLNDSKYNGKYLLGNLLVCGDCGASYRRRTERGKLADLFVSGVYDENIIMEKVVSICIHHNRLVIKIKSDENYINMLY
ncbi:site-specific recombinase [Fusibacter sp. 3D3]|nr:site-specific recombinase [Fusibacter sp. 3D3]